MDATFRETCVNCLLMQDGRSLKQVLDRVWPGVVQEISFRPSGHDAFHVDWAGDRNGYAFGFAAPAEQFHALVLAHRWTCLFDIFALCRERGDAIGRTLIDLDDRGGGKGLRFCDTRALDGLWPDPDFLESRAYALYRDIWNDTRDWDERRDVAFWRGSSTGICDAGDAVLLPRVRLALLSQGHEDLDCALTNYVQLSPTDRDRLAALVPLGAYVDAATYDQYRYHIDIDGNASAWSGLFVKLLSGGVVLKVESEYRQWYYDRLVPWHNFVPVKADLSDLRANLDILQRDRALAQEIAGRGRDLALSLTYQSQISLACDRAVGEMQREQSTGSARALHLE